MKWVVGLICAALVIWVLAPNSARLRRRAAPDLSDDQVKFLMGFDRNGDGRLERNEVPERMQGLFDRGDTNKDGFLTPQEIRRLAESQILPATR